MTGARGRSLQPFPLQEGFNYATRRYIGQASAERLLYSPAQFWLLVAVCDTVQAENVLLDEQLNVKLAGEYYRSLYTYSGDQC